MRAQALLPAAVLFLASVSAGQADEAPRYRPWVEPGGAAEGMVEQLRALIEQAAKARAADPRFLDDLTALADRFDTTRAIELLSDDFRDGDFTSGTAWTVQRGRFWVEDAVGLRSYVTAPAPTAAAPAPPRRAGGKVKGEDLAIAIIGDLLGRPSAQQSAPAAGGEPAAPEPAPVQIAEITTAAAIPRAFLARIEITSRKLPTGQAVPGGAFRFGPFQGTSTGNGYQLAYVAGANLRLLRLASGAATVIATSKSALSLEDGRLHVIELARNEAGRLSARIDGVALLEAADPGLRDPFDGFTLVNSGGDYAVRSISINRYR